MIETDVVIVGAGVSGIAMAAKLREAGIENFVILDKGDSFGGTWHDNVYPGACCDVPAALYSFSFSPNPDWSRIYPPQGEIEQYLQGCAHAYRLGEKLRPHSEVTAAHYQDDGRWLVILAGGEQLRCRILVSGLGQLNRPFIPDFKGRERFNGVQMHTARWDKSVDLTGKRIAVIGNAASAIQLIPPLARTASALFIYQRSANYIIPRNDRAYTDTEKRVFRHWPMTQKALRAWYFFYADVINFSLMLAGSVGGRFGRWLAQRYMRKTVARRELWEALTPDYPIGCKRVLVSDDYYQSLNLPSVNIVTAPISGIDEAGVVSADGVARPVDAIIYATGFRATEFLAPLEVSGMAGAALREVWRDGAEAHRGVCQAGFPNFYMLYGPNTNLGHNSIIYMVEKQVGYIAQCVEKTLASDFAGLDVLPSAQTAFNQRIQRDLAKTVWGGACGSWYKNAAGKIINNWPYRAIRFAREMRKVNFNEYKKITLPGEGESAS